MLTMESETVVFGRGRQGAGIVDADASTMMGGSTLQLSEDSETVVFRASHPPYNIDPHAATLTDGDGVEDTPDRH